MNPVTAVTYLSAGLILTPVMAAVLVLLFRKSRILMRGFFMLGSIIHTVLSVLSITVAMQHNWPCGEFLGMDFPASFFLAITSGLFLIAAFHILFWLPVEISIASFHDGKKVEPPLMKENIFLSCLLGFLSTMTLSVLARDLGLLWVAIEATTLLSAPLIFFHKSAAALEAMWKYLLICSVGIGLALFGTMLLWVSGFTPGESSFGLSLAVLENNRAYLNPLWYRASFIFVLVGYGTKMGLAPFHTWLPDAHSEAPAPVSALLSGVLLNCSFLGIYRFFSLVPNLAERQFAQGLLLFFGVLSLVIAAVFMVRQKDFKRLLAYSSVEHMGIGAILCALDCEGIVFLHLMGHSFIKMALFLIAGNLLLAYGTRECSKLGGIFGTTRKNAYIWLVGILFICGLPPSPLFFTELWMILSAPGWLACLFIFLLFAIFAAMSYHALNMTMGPVIAMPGDRVPWLRRIENLRYASLVALLTAFFFGIIYFMGNFPWEGVK